MAAHGYDDSPAVTPSKGYDDSPPRNGVIFFYTVVAIIFLGAVDVLLDSYFARVMGGEVHDKVLSRGLDDAIEQRAREQEVLEKSGIANAKRAIAQRGRSVSPIITPESGAGKPEVTGWSQLKREVASVPPAPASDTSADEAKAGAGQQPVGDSKVTGGSKPVSKSPASGVGAGR